MIVLITRNKQQFEHIVHQYRIERDQVRHLQSPYHLRGLQRDTVVMFAEEWWRGWRDDDVIEIEHLVMEHNARRRTYASLT